MSIPPELLPVVQITLPIVLAIFAAIYVQNRQFDIINKRLDDLRTDLNKRTDDLRTDLNRRLDEIIKRLDNIETALTSHGERIAKLEERIPPLARR